jgi:MinD superfamily P-loop ATPase
MAIPQWIKKLCDNCGLCAQVCRFHALAVLPSDILVLANLCHGCGACTYLCPRKAISERDYPIGSVSSFSQPGLHFVQGRLDVGQAMAPPVIRAAKKSIDYNALVIIDSPPGSSCPVIQSVKDSDFCLLVTEPTPSACTT